MEKKFSFLFGAGAEFSMNILYSEQNQESESLQNFKTKIENWQKEVDLEKQAWLLNNRSKIQFYQFTTTDFAKLIESGLEKNSQYIIEQVKIYLETAGDQSWFESAIGSRGEEGVNNFAKVLIQFMELTEFDCKLDQLEQMQLTLRYIQRGYRYAQIYNDLHGKSEETNKSHFFGNETYADYVKLNYNKFETVKIIAHLKKEKLLLSIGASKTDYDKITFEVRKNLCSLLETIINSLIDYQSLVDQYWHYLLNPGKNWSKFTKISTFLYRVEAYLKQTQEKSQNIYSYYEQVYDNFGDKIRLVATTNYTKYSSEIFGDKVRYLNGSLGEQLELYSNRIINSEAESESRLTVPFLFTQSGTKSLVNIRVAQRYSEVYQAYLESDCVCIIGYGFNSDDSHINST